MKAEYWEMATPIIFGLLGNLVAEEEVGFSRRSPQSRKL